MRLQEFWAYVDPAPVEMCWEWGRSIGKPGYGTCWVDGKSYNAHKLAYSLAYGPVPSGMVVRHSCHNRSCCNPNHLSIGTQRQNMRDSVESGRTARGSRQGNAKLTSEQVRQIKRMASYRTQQAIADHFGVNQCQISRILSGSRWVHHSSS